MTTIVTIDMGGTGAATPEGARAALGVTSAGDSSNAYTQANTSYAQANTAYNQANTARSDANTTFATVNTTFGTINTNYQAAYAQANTARDTGNNAYGSANLAYAQANNARSDTNTTFATINTTFGTVNTSLDTINTNYQAAYAQANTARSDANTTFATVNTTFGTINTNYQAAYAQANTARSDANTTFATVNTTFSTLNSSFSTTNTNYQAAYSQANTARDTANNAYGSANLAYAQANTARDTANNAYNNSNTKLSTSGGSISGDLSITGNLVVQGNATTINVTNLSVNDSMILLAAGGTGDSTDIGFVGHIQNGATNTHVGLIRKATENRFYLFDNYEVEPTNNVIDVTGNNFRVGNLRLNTINANSFVTSAGLDVTGQANAAYGQANAAYTRANTKLDSAGGTISGNLVVTGSLTVSGNVSSINTQSISSVSNEIILNSNASGAPTLDGKLTINRGSSSNVTLLWNETADKWGWTDNGTTYYYFEDLRSGLATHNTTFGTTNTTFGTLNTTFGTVNTSLATINTNYQAAYAQANTAGTNALNAYGQANAAYGQANAAYGQANSAYGAANNRVLKAGDTMTGGLIIQADASNEQLKIIRSSNTNQQLIFGAHSSNYGWIQSVEQNVGYTSLVLNRDGGNVGVGATPAFTTGSGLEIQRATATATLRLDSSSFATELYGYTGGTGLFQLSAGYLDLGTNNTTRLRIDANGNVSIGTSSTTASLQVQGASGDAAPIFRISATAAAGSFNWASSFLNSSLGSGRNFISLIGQAESTKNSGYIGFNHSGTSGSNSNFLTFGLFGVDNILNITGAANVGIGNTAPVAKLQVTQAAPSGAGAVPSGTTAVFENAGNNYITMRHSADGGFYSGMVFEDNNIGGFVVHGDGGSGDKLYIAGYGGVDIQYGSSSSVTPGARSTVGSFTSTGLSVTGTISADTVRVTTGSLANTSATLGLMLDGNYSTGQYRHRFRKQDLGGGLPLFLDYSSGTANSYTTIARFGGGGSYNELTIYGAFEVTGSSYFGNSIRLQGTSPTITFYDTDNMTGYIHTNSNLMYILRGANGATEGGWAQVNSQWPFTFNLSNNDAVCGGNLNAVGDVVTSYSDLRLKNIRGKITNALDKVKQLSGYYYTDNDLAREKGYTNDQEQVGVLAQEIEKVLPQVLTPAPFDIEFKDGKYISRSGENYMTVKYDRIIPLLIEAIKEQQEQIEELKKKLGA